MKYRVFLSPKGEETEAEEQTLHSQGHTVSVTTELLGFLWASDLMFCNSPLKGCMIVLGPPEPLVEM